jgi:hypothetical protein
MVTGCVLFEARPNYKIFVRDELRLQRVNQTLSTA